MDARTAALASVGDHGRRSGGIRITFPRREDSGVGELAFGAPGKHRLPLVGAIASFSVDEKMANSGGALRGGGILDWGKNRHPGILIPPIPLRLSIWRPDTYGALKLKP